MSHNIRQWFRNLGIKRKMLFGYLTLAFITVILGAFAVSGLESINRLNSSLINVLSPIIKTTDALSEAILQQELYGRRAAILNTPQALELFSAKSTEARDLANELEGLLQLTDVIPPPGLPPLIEEYTALFELGKEELAAPKTEAGKTHDQQVKSIQEMLLTKLQDINEKAKDAQSQLIQNSFRTSEAAFWAVVIMSSLGILLGVVAATLITNNIASSVNTLKKATHQVSEGNFDNLPSVESEDEIGELSRAFGEMAIRLRALEEMYLDASPLTRLPGGVAIENVLRKRLSSGESIAFCLLDVDDFKAYNDRYGYARGSELILALGRIIEEKTRQLGNSTDFVGHVGGDDFVLITTPDHFEPICSAVIEEFDRTIPNLYDKEDAERGYIEGKTRQGIRMSFPLSSISIAVVTNTKRHITNHLQMGEIASELKEYAKSIPGSLYVVDHRKKEV